jgi:hypothetical protein
MISSIAIFLNGIKWIGETSLLVYGAITGIFYIAWQIYGIYLFTLQFYYTPFCMPFFYTLFYGFIFYIYFVMLILILIAMTCGEFIRQRNARL